MGAPGCINADRHSLLRVANAEDRAADHRIGSGGLAAAPHPGKCNHAHWLREGLDRGEMFDAKHTVAAVAYQREGAPLWHMITLTQAFLRRRVGERNPFRG